MITIYEETNSYDICSIIMEITLKNGMIIKFIYSNEQNGYYSHDVWLTLAENDDDEPMGLIKTSI